MDRLDYYFRQKVTEAELDLGFSNAENADWNQVVDADFVGIHTGLAVTAQGVPNMTVAVTLGSAYDSAGRRVRVPALQTVNCATDFNSISTTVTGVGNERWVSIFAGYTRALSDARTDGNALTVYFQRAESFELRVVSGVEATSGSAARPVLDASRILLADVRLVYGGSTVTAGSISTTRRQDTFVASVSPIVVQNGRVKEVVTSLVTQLAAHVNQASGAHAATAITYAGGGTWGEGTTNPATTVEAQLDKVIADLALKGAGVANGASKVGSVAGYQSAAQPFYSTSQTVGGQLQDIMAYASVGPRGLRRLTLTTTTTLGAEDRQTGIDTSGAAFTVTLPAPIDGRVIHIKDTKGTFGTNNLTVARSGAEKIEGLAASYVCSASWGSYRFWSDGTDWYVD